MWYHLAMLGGNCVDVETYLSDKVPLTQSFDTNRREKHRGPSSQCLLLVWWKSCTSVPLVRPVAAGISRGPARLFGVHY